ncbi:MAG: bifunctional methylenetetrahydrofolate dehydrogenase/methenyltetrahydrofolate cyclohydrolase FolD [Parvularculales bacterium]
MSACIIDGKSRAETLQNAVTRAVSIMREAHNVIPGLAAVLVGDDPASQVYVRNKIRRTQQAGMMSFEKRFPANTSEAIIIQTVRELNNDSAVHGILTQLPLPASISWRRVIETIAPEKDVDGLHPFNAGFLAGGQAAMIPCTPLGCRILLRDYLGDMSGAHALIIGRSVLVGRPLATLLVEDNCTVTLSHSRTRNLSALAQTADILIAATGQAEMVRGDWIKPGSTIIDVGINRVPVPDGEKGRLVGDVAFDEAVHIAGAITPVPGGVGPMTIACLLRNTLAATCKQHDITLPDTIASEVFL